MTPVQLLSERRNSDAVGVWVETDRRVPKGLRVMGCSPMSDEQDADPLAATVTPKLRTSGHRRISRHFLVEPHLRPRPGSATSWVTRSDGGAFESFGNPQLRVPPYNSTRKPPSIAHIHTRTHLRSHIPSTSRDASPNRCFCAGNYGEA